MTEFGLTNAGFIPMRTEDWLSVIRDDFENELGGVAIDWSRQTVLGPLTLALARRLASNSETLQAAYDVKSLNNSSGAQLDDVGQLNLTSRIGATKSTATVTLASTAASTVDVFVGEGTIVQGGGLNGRARWVTIEDATIPSGGATVDVLVEAEDAGAVPALIGEINRIVSPLTGWDSVTNPAAATLGRDIELDGAFRRRMAEAPSRAGSGTVPAVRESVLALDGVTSCLVIENEESTIQVVEGVSMDPNSIGVYVYPPTLTSAQIESVVAEIFDKKAGGIKTIGTNAATVNYGQVNYSIRYSFPADLGVAVIVNITALPTGTTVADITDAITQVVTEYFSELLPGVDLYQLDLLNRLKNDIPQILAATVSFNGSSTTPVTVNANQIATLGSLVIP